MSNAFRGRNRSMSRILKSLGGLPIGFGGASISGEGAGYGFGDISEDEACRLLRYTFDRGIRLFDTAPIYGFGESEIRIGKAFKDIREKVYIVSKSGVSWHDSKRVNMTNEPKETQKMLEDSLRRLDSDYIDHYMIHWPDSRVDIRKTMEVLSKAKLQGKIKSIGLCNTYLDDFNKASEVDKISSLQSELNIFSRHAVDSLLPIAKENDLSFMSWGTLDKGILTGRVNAKRKFDKSDCRSWAPWWKSMDKEDRYRKMEIINKVISKFNLSPISLALGFNLSHENVDMVLCGGRSEKQWDGLIDSLSNLPKPEQLEEVLKSIDEN